LKEYSRG